MKGFKVEQVNPNDLEFLVLSKHFSNGDEVTVGQVLFELEGQKAAFDVVAESAGYVYSNLEVNDYFDVDAHAYFLSDKQDEVLKVSESIEDLPGVSNDFVEVSPALLPELRPSHIKIAVAPGGKAFSQVRDALSCSRVFELVGFFDDAEKSNADKLGNLNDIQDKWSKGKFDRIFIATGNAVLRTRLIIMAHQIGIPTINVIHPTSYIAESAMLGSNIFVGPNVVIGASSIINSGVFLSAFTNVEHHCYVGENVLTGPGVMLSGSVTLGSRSVLGAGVSVESNISIGSDVYVAPGFGVSNHLDSGSRLINKV